MPKRAQQDYESDDGFVADAPESKKVKGDGASEGKKANRNGANEGQKAPVITGTQQDDEGNAYWELSRVRRVGLQNFKGADMVSIREFYEKDGKALPGKKGISLSIDQYITLMDILPQVEKALKAKGIDVPRPDYSEAVIATKADEDVGDDGESEEADAGEDAEDVKPASGKLDKFKMKANHEATSDEDDS